MSYEIPDLKVTDILTIIKSLRNTMHELKSSTGSVYYR